MAAHENHEREGEGGAERLQRPWSRALIGQILLLAAAAAAGAVALYFSYAEDAAEIFHRHLAARSSWLPPLVVAAGMVLVCRLRDGLFPGTEGTGIPQVMAALALGEGPGRAGVLSLRIALGKLILLTLALLSGATIGREGPSVHVGACCLYLSSRLVRLPRHLIERGLIVAGGAAGIGAAFNTPLAAMIFAFEEIARSFEKENAATVVRTVIVACLVCWVPLSNYLFYGAVETQLVSLGDWLLVPLVGVIGGLLGGGFAQAVASATPRVRRWSGRHPYTTATGLGLALAALGVTSGGLTYGSGFVQAQAILIEGRDLPAGYPLAKALGSYVSLISAIPGGLFDPSLSVGAGLGQLAWPVVPQMERQAFVLLVMGAYFAGVVQSPITAAVILVEMTSATRMTLPLLATTILAYHASRRVCRTALYESLARGFLARTPRG